ncbi:MAG: phosphoesterase [Candidatus Dormibacteraeota bacterium]|nr:phosphoesterase [Candidatus Dormibacteraeota bacterium]
MCEVIDHVFVLMLENRSFDHMLGWSELSGCDAVTGRPTTTDGLTGQETNRLPSGGLVTVSAGADYVMTVDPGHEFADVLEQLCGPGATYPDPAGGYPRIDCSGFASRIDALIERTGAGCDPSIVMRGFRPAQVPVLTTLAAEFAVCDRWFSSLPGPTWPNRYFVHAASSAGLDDSPSPLQSAESLLEGWQFANGTIFDRLNQAGLRWTVVEGDSLPQALGISGMVESALDGHFVSMEDLKQRLADPEFDDTYVFIEPHYGHVLADGANFKCGSSQHPLDDVTHGERLLKDVYESIRNSPHWARSLLIVTYDEHGGFYDHVAPPVAVPPGDSTPPGHSHNGFRFDRLGVRVPAVIVSPYTARGLIDHTVYDHTSVLATVENLFGLAPLTARDAAAARLDHLFGLPRPRTDAPLALPPAAHSGVADCMEAILAADLEVAPAHLDGRLEPALAGFVQLALARDLHLAASADHDLAGAIRREKRRLQRTWRGIRTKFDAVRYLRDVETRYQAARR